jgi:hypothetical protein
MIIAIDLILDSPNVIVSHAVFEAKNLTNQFTQCTYDIYT